MPTGARTALLTLSLMLLMVGLYHRIRAAAPREKLDRTKEGWPILIGLRVSGLTTFGSTAAWIWNPTWFRWASFAVPDWVRWIGVGGYSSGSYG